MKKILWRIIRTTGSEPVFLALASVNDFFRRFIPRHNFYAPGKKLVVRHGIRFSLDLSDYTQWKIYSYNRDMGARLAFSKLKNKESLVLDIGSNVGAFSFELITQFLRAGDRQLSIYTFEPNPVTFSNLVTNVSLNRFPETISVRPYNLGIGASRGTLKLNVKKGHSGASSLYSDDEGSAVVDVWPLDEFIEKNNISSVDFVKIDVECFEPFVLQGGEEAFRKFKPVIYLEHSIKCNSRHQMGEDFIYNFLKRHGYTIEAEVGNDLVKIGSFEELKALGKVNILAMTLKS